MGWRQFTNMEGRMWWWNQESNTSFWEDDCDSDTAADGDGEDLGEDVEFCDDLESLGLMHLRRTVCLSRPRPTDMDEASSPVRYTGKVWEFQVVLDRSTTDDKFGLDFRVDQGTPVVSQVKASGTCGEHNFDMQQFPEDSPLHQMQVVPGDRVKVVNGFTDSEDIKKELTNALVVHLRVLRPAHPPESAVALQSLLQ